MSGKLIQVGSNEDLSLLEEALVLTRDYEVTVTKPGHNTFYLRPAESRNFYSFGREDFEIVITESLEKMKFVPERLSSPSYIDTSLDLTFKKQTDEGIAYLETYVLAELNPFPVLVDNK